MEARLRYREGSTADLRAAFELAQAIARDEAEANEIVPADEAASWGAVRPLQEFLAAQPGSCWLCESDGELVGYARVLSFDGVEQLAELEVAPAFQGRGVGRGLLERCWPGDPTPDLARVVIASGAPAALSLYTDFGVMPVAGSWSLRHGAADYLTVRSRELADVGDPAVAALELERALRDWRRLEEAALGHPRPALHEFFGRDHTCLGALDGRGRAVGLCWVAADGQIGPAVGERPEDLVPVVLAALDRVAAAGESPSLSIDATSTAWWLLRRLRTLGFHVRMPSWIMSSEPIPGLDRYVPTRPAYLL